ncbi:unnamed protein product [Bursaphelenchus okinawaensis]|uniref:Serpentine receptor class gamma n=1 Tax=Bursaphelenchus okinawaensis TaxID=465554 RepID=A0A811LKI6_9BILA|nr:unnamed protein product [Bursaphelenchus okinawaensis]CAG9124189.1 unnamed protein product [Bursaphelenchus okinawaensis]
MLARLVMESIVGLLGVIFSIILIMILMCVRKFRKRNILRTIASTILAEGLYCLSFCIPLWSYLIFGHVMDSNTTKVIAYVNEVVYKAQMYHHSLLEITRVYYTFIQRPSPIETNKLNDFCLLLCWMIGIATISTYFYYGRVLNFDYTEMTWAGHSVWNVLIRCFYTMQWLALFAGLAAAGAVIIAFYVKIPSTRNIKKTIEGKIFLQTILLSSIDAIQMLLTVAMSSNGMRTSFSNILTLCRCSLSAPLYIFLNREIRGTLRRACFVVTGTYVQSSMGITYISVTKPVNRSPNITIL